MNKSTNNSNAIETHNKESIKELFLNIKNLFILIFEYRLATRALSLMLILALLMPLIFLGNFNSVSAQGNSSSDSTPISAPPIAYKLGGNVANQFISPAVLVSNSVSSVASYVTAPSLPVGFEIANTSSPLYKDISSGLTSIGSVLGLVVNPSSSESNSNLVADDAFPGDAVPFDFDNDDIADVSRWNPATGEWKVKDAQGNLTTNTFGTSSSVIVPGDFDGDDKTDKAVFDAGTWTIRKSDGTGDITYPFGTTADIPVTGDFDLGGKSDYVIFRPSTNTWWIRSIETGTVTSTAFGATGDIPVQGDYDGDGKTDIAIYRPSTGDWHISASTAGYYSIHWGISSDTPIPADFNGDGKTDFGIYRPSTGTWYIYYSDFTTSYTSEVWGNYGDQPVAADYDGDGKADLSVWRPKSGVWLIKESNGGAYKYETLGMNGDVPVPSAYIKKVGSSVPDYDFAKLRLKPINSTGGTDLYSRNFVWETGLVGLAGRSELGAGFGISYNSLVWLKDDENDTISFNPDYSNLTPGFNFGYSRIEPVYWDKNNGRFSYIMVTPSGARVEFQQIGATDTYETVDSSYVQLKTVGASNPNDPVENISITVTGTDGTKMEYEWKAGAFRAKEIKDTNGNYITIVHDDYGLLKTVTDTLGRVITVNYDAELYPTTITQDWKTNNGSGSATTFTFATFNYTNKTITTDFDSSLTVFGPPNGTSIKVLDKIIVASGAYTQFEYNDYAQVWKINTHAIDGHKLKHKSFNLQNPSANQLDVPRFTETRSWVENFNLEAGSTESQQEIAVQNTFQENQSYTTPAASGTGTLIQVSMVNHPHGNISKTYVGDSGWMESLPIVTEDWADENSTLIRKRWSWTNWTQDDANLIYINNPRSIERKVGDDENNNVKRTTTDYRLLPNTTIAEFGLVESVKIYDSDQTTVLKEVQTDYNFNTAYISRRIIGLPNETREYGREGGVLPMTFKITFAYDEGDFSDSTLEQNITPIQHDSTNYGATFIVGRGNLTSTIRHDPSGQLSSVTSNTKYNTSGSPVIRTSPSPNSPNGRVVKTKYTDNFNDSISNKNTYAYPTKIYDPNGNLSEITYRYDIGLNVKAKSPSPIPGISFETVREYDSLGRPEKQILLNTGAYIKYDYSSQSELYFKTQSAFIDANQTNSADAADETTSEIWVDGEGRVLKSRYENSGNVEGYTGTIRQYNKLGQEVRSTVPTEVDSNWNPTGDDDRGLDVNNNVVWLWESQEYDWNGRVKRKINTDGTDKIISYEGCGCAGGDIITIQSESVPRDDIPSQNARRTSKVHSDFLGRKTKTEIMDWNGNVSLSTVHEFNGRDQITTSSVTDLASSQVQVTDITYDGFGRIKSEHLPQMDQGTSRIYNYNADDSIKNKFDARGSKTSYSYNNLGLLAMVDYLTPQNSSLPNAPSISFGYDNLGNRIWMEDGVGRIDYEFDDLSRLASETRTYDVSLTDAPQSSGGFRFDYTYHLDGNLKKITYPNGVTVENNLDKEGKLKSLTGTIDGQAKTFLSNIEYRSWGAPKQIDFGNETNLHRTFNNRLLPDTEKFTGKYFVSGSAETRTLVDNKYEYYNDGKVKLIKDLSFLNNQPYRYYDRLLSYDYAGRITKERTGRQALGTAQSGDFIKYKHDIIYDAFGNYKTYNSQSSFPHTANPNPTSNYNFVNNRRMAGTVTYNGQWYANILPSQYDSDGRITDDGTLESTYDNAGYISHRSQGTNDDQYFTQDGNGNLAKVKDVSKSTETIGNQTTTDITTITRYSLRSSLIGEAIVYETRLKQEYDDVNQPPVSEQTATVDVTNIYGIGKKIATFTSSIWYSGDPQNPVTSLDFEFDTAFGQNQIKTYFENSGTSSTSGFAGIEYFNSIGVQMNSLTPGSAGRSAGVRWDTTGFNSYSNGGRCSADGVFEFCENAYRLIGYEGNGGGVQCPDNYCGPQVAEGEDTGRRILTGVFTAHADGSSGHYVDTWLTSNQTIYEDGPDNDEDIDLGQQITQFFEEKPCEFSYHDLFNTFKPLQEVNNDVWKDTVKSSKKHYEDDLNKKKSTSKPFYGDERGYIAFYRKKTKTIKLYGYVGKYKTMTEEFSTTFFQSVLKKEQDQGYSGQVVAYAHSHLPAGPALLAIIGPFTDEQIEKGENYKESWDPKDVEPANSNPSNGFTGDLSVSLPVKQKTPYFSLLILGINNSKVIKSHKTKINDRKKICLY